MTPRRNGLPLSLGLDLLDQLPNAERPLTGPAVLSPRRPDEQQARDQHVDEHERGHLKPEHLNTYPLTVVFLQVNYRARFGVPERPKPRTGLRTTES